jgi:hypothetical protein
MALALLIAAVVVSVALRSEPGRVVAAEVASAAGDQHSHAANLLG